MSAEGEDHGNRDEEIDWCETSSSRRDDLQKVLEEVDGFRRQLEDVSRLDDNLIKQTGLPLGAFLDLLEDTARAEFEEATRPEQIDTGMGDCELPEPDHHGEMVINSHYNYEPHDWIEIDLSMPMSTYERLEKRAKALNVEPADLMYDLVKVAGTNERGFYTGLKIDFTPTPGKNR